MSATDADWMALAYQQALLAKDRGEVPVGAVVVSEDGRCLAQTHNRVITDTDPTAHAEVLAVRAAAKVFGNYRLNHAIMYVTLEPCAMCAAALVHARIARLVFACRDFKAGAAGSVFNILKGAPLNHAVYIDEGIMQDACNHLLLDFFQEKR